MSIGTLSHSTGLSQLAERQMRTWALQLEAQRRLEEERAAKAMEQRIHPYLVLSRETGVNAGELAHAIGAISWIGSAIGQPRVASRVAGGARNGAFAPNRRAHRTSPETIFGWPTVFRRNGVARKDYRHAL